MILKRGKPCTGFYGGSAFLGAMGGVSKWPGQGATGGMMLEYIVKGAAVGAVAGAAGYYGGLAGGSVGGLAGGAAGGFAGGFIGEQLQVGLEVSNFKEAFKCRA